MPSINTGSGAEAALREGGRTIRWSAVCWLLLLVLLPACGLSAPPRTARKPVTNDYSGVQVTEDYQWLEDAGDPSVRKWTATQNDATRDFLDKLPTRTALEYQLRRLFSAAGPDYSSLRVVRGRIFALKQRPLEPQPVLVAFSSLTNLEPQLTVLDPNTTEKTNSWSIDAYEPSPDGQLVAVCRSGKGGPGTLRVYESASGRELPDLLACPATPMRDGSVAWAPDSSGFYYARSQAPGTAPSAGGQFYQQVYFHKLGAAPEEDRYEIGREFPRLAEVQLKSGGEEGRYLVATVANGDGGDRGHWLRDPSGRWRQIARFEDRVQQIEFGHEPVYIEWPADPALYLLSLHRAPRGRILRVTLANPELAQAREVIKESRKILTAFVPSASGLYLQHIDGGLSELRFHDFYAQPEEPESAAPENGAEETNGVIPAHGEPDEHPDATENGAAHDDTAANMPADAEAEENDGTRSTEDIRASPRRGASHIARKEFTVPLHGAFSVQQMICLRGDELLVRTAGFLTVPVWQTYNPGRDRDRVHSTAFRRLPAADFADVEVIRESVRSKDGTKVPMHIIRHRGIRLNGQNPTLLTGSGGFGVAMAPHLDLSWRVWLDQGGVVVLANLRGGNEYGENWHQAGRLTAKQHVFDDFVACAELLIRSNYTSPAKLVIEGEGNGGLLVGAALTERPDLFRAAVAQFGIFDMLRAERDAAGEFRTTELGSVQDQDQFRALRAYSPYHHVENGTAYPAMLLLTGEQDERINPAHSRKMAARLQAATASKLPVLLGTSGASSHTPRPTWEDRLAQLVDIYSFLFEQLGMEYSEITRGPWSGAVTPTSALVKAELTRAGAPVRLAVSMSPLLTRPSYTPLVRAGTNRHGVLAFPLERLKPDTQYFYALEVDGRLDRLKRGQFRTFPNGPASFSFAYASCARSGSTSTIFDTIRENHPLFFMNIGDWHYENIAVNDLARFHAAYDFVLSSPQQADLYRSAPFVYIWDDHDYGGNNANRTARSHDAARLAYEEYVPHYPLAGESGPIYQSFSVGRVKFILTDLRSERDPVTNRDDAAKSMMGARQKQWFKQELLAANGKYPLICWVSSVPWIGTKGSNYYRIGTNVFGYIHHTTLTNSLSARSRSRAGSRAPGSEEDHWSVYATERREIADFIKTNHIQGVCILHGDSHMLAADDGTYSDYATGGGAPLPVMCAAPLDRDPSIKGGPYSQGVYRVNDRKGEGAFGLVTITDLGEEIQVRYSGRNRWNEEKISLRFKVPARSAPAETQWSKPADPKS